MRLSKNFLRSEFACSCCGKSWADDPLVDALQDLRNLVELPINITSGCRCNAHNRAIGGASRSYHVSGNAVDIYVMHVDPLALATTAQQIEAFNRGGIGLYPGDNGTFGFVHLDNRNMGRHARWGRLCGEYCTYEGAAKYILKQRSAGYYDNVFGGV